MVSCLIFCQQYGLVAIVLGGFILSVPTEVKFSSKNRDNVLAHGFFHKVKGSHHVAMVRHREGFHTQCLGFGNEGWDFRSGLQYRKLRVYMQVRELAIRYIGSRRLLDFAFRRLGCGNILWLRLSKISLSKNWSFVADLIKGHPCFSGLYFLID